MFDFRLKVFHTVASRLNFTKAAEELFITQPAVTKHIHETEQHFKVKLFERGGRKTQLTAAGQTLFRHTTELFTLYRNLEFEMNMQAEKKRAASALAPALPLPSMYSHLYWLHSIKNSRIYALHSVQTIRNRLNKCCNNGR